MTETPEQPYLRVVFEGRPAADIDIEGDGIVGLELDAGVLIFHFEDGRRELYPPGIWQRVETNIEL